jgi:glycerol-3-phosphate dehydrogenase (NAD(P)+)
MGTALARVLGDSGHNVTMWNYAGDPDPLNQIAAYHENKKYLPGIMLAKNVRAEHDLQTALSGAQLVILAVPSTFVERQLETATPFLPKSVVLLDVSKGFTGVFSKQKSALSGAAQTWWNKRIIISGPAVAADIAKGGFTTMSIAGKNTKAIAFAQKVLTSSHLHFLPTTDVLGIKLAGSLKNIYAILLGMADGLNLPLNTKAFLVVRALEEMSLLIKKCGGKAETPHALAGLGDLVATGLSPISRNRRFGEFLGQGLDRVAAEKAVGQVVEGVEANKMLVHLAGHYGVAMPVAQLIYKIVWKNVDPKKELELFLQNFKI